MDPKKDIKKRNKELLKACYQKNIDIELIKQLILQGASPKDANLFGKTVLHYICSKKSPNFEIIDLLLENGADPLAKDLLRMNCLHFLLQNSCFDVKLITFFLDKGVSPNDVNNKEENPLHYACSNSAPLHVIELLIHYGADVTMVQDCGDNYLHYACYGYYASVELIKLLIAKGVDPKALGNSQRTLLHNSCSNNNLELIQYLIEDIKLDPTLLNDAGRTCLYDACERSHPNIEIIQLLLNKSVDPKITDKNGINCLSPLCFKAVTDTSVFSLLVSRGLDPYLVNDRGRNYLHLACVNFPQNMALISHMLDLGINPSTKDNFGKTCLSYTRSPNPSLIQLFLERGDLNTLNNLAQDIFALDQTSLVVFLLLKEVLANNIKFAHEPENSIEKLIVKLQKLETEGNQEEKKSLLFSLEQQITALFSLKDSYSSISKPEQLQIHTWLLFNKRLNKNKNLIPKPLQLAIGAKSCNFLAFSMMQKLTNEQVDNAIKEVLQCSEVLTLLN